MRPYGRQATRLGGARPFTTAKDMALIVHATPFGVGSDETRTWTDQWQVTRRAGPRNNTEGTFKKFLRLQNQPRITLSKRKNVENMSWGVK